MIPHALIINGPPGVGKSTVSSALRTLMPGTMCISGDALRSFAPAEARAILGPGSTYRAAAELAAFYLKSGATRVVFEYVFETPKQLEHFTALSGEWKSHRSSRLGIQYRVTYRVVAANQLFEVVSVTAHDYRRP